jgi:hypothetical protein
LGGGVEVRVSGRRDEPRAFVIVIGWRCLNPTVANILPVEVKIGIPMAQLATVFARPTIALGE